MTQDLSGWSAYKVKVESCRRDGISEVWLEAQIIYSSTCPCSASLARQVIADRFHADHKGRNEVSVDDVRHWIARHGTAATPHSQRSVARVRVRVDPASSWCIERLLDLVEAALGTASQGPVKRADEQEFARLNGQNLMFVEDAARRLLAELQQSYDQGAVEVTHLESLHPHDAYAFVAWGEAA
mgnify:CR=1 FL=1